MQIALYGSIAWRHPFGFAQVITVDEMIAKIEAAGGGAAAAT